MAGAHDVEVRGISPDEVEAFARSIAVPFLGADQGPPVDHSVRHVEPDRAWAAVDRGRFVGNAAILSRTITLPGAPGEDCPDVPLGAITAVGVHPTHRRLGLLRRLMAAMLDQARERGEALAGLIASEAAIYGRFGFGRSVAVANVAVDRRDLVFTRPPAPLDLRLLTVEELGKELPERFERCRRLQPGQVNRNEAVWADRMAEAERRDPPVFAAVADDGLVTWQVREDGPESFERGQLTVRDLLGTTPEVEAGLWAFLGGIDLVHGITATRRPVAEPVSWRLADPRALRTTELYDALWLRVLDLPAALTARRWPVADRLVLDVGAPGAGGRAPDDLAEADRDRVLGTWVLDAGPEGCTVERASAGTPADLTLAVDDLGSILLGGFAPSDLAAGGRIAASSGALGAADRLFAASPTRMSTFF